MNNLLSDSFFLPRSGGSRGSDIEAAIQDPMGSAALGLEGFLYQVQAVEKLIEQIASLSKKLQDSHEESKAVIKATVVKEIKKRMEKDILEVGKVALLAIAKLKELDEDNLINRQKPGCGKGSSVDRSRTATTATLKKKLKERMSDFQALRETIGKDYRVLVERRVFTVTGIHDEEELIDQLIETGNSEQIFEKAILEQGLGKIMDTLAEIQERHDSVKEIERKLLELQQIFLDMAVLTDTQGEILDDIEAQVSSAANYVQNGASSLEKAKIAQKNSHKWICILITVLLIIIVLAVAVVIIILKPWKKDSKNGTIVPVSILSWHEMSLAQQLRSYI